MICGEILKMDNQREQLLMVDDDQIFCGVVKDYLTNQGFNVAVVYNGVAMTQYLSEHIVDLLILDVMLPDEDGLSLARWLRAENYQQPIIMLSAAREEADRVVGLEIGADDYLTKPASLRELLARVRAALRRHTGQLRQFTPPIANPNVYTFRPFTLDTECHRLTKDDVEVSLTDAEYNLLLAFVTHSNQILSRNRLLNLVKGYEHTPHDRSIDVVVSRLRTKIEADPGTPSYVRTIRNKGYLFSPSNYIA